VKFYTTEQLGPKRYLTPEGFLVCQDVPLARTGPQLYRDGEVPVPAKDGVVRIERDEEDVFRPETIASGMGKPLVDDHPMEDDPLSDGFDVHPENWSRFSKGTVLNPRRGEGSSNDLLMGDVMVMDSAAIKAIMDGKVELSCGYNADYETIEPGRGRQKNIVINHVALVDSGRCGSRCSIGDADMRTRDKSDTYSTVDKAMAALEKIKRAFKAKDEGMLNEGMSQVTDEITGMGSEVGKLDKGDGANNIHIHLPGAAAGSPSNTPTADDPSGVTGVDPAAGGDPMTVLGARLEKLEALFTKFAPILAKLGGAAPAATDDDPAGTLETEEEPADTEGTETADGGLFGGEVEMDDPAPAATGDGKTKDGATVVGQVVRTKDGKLVARKLPTATARDSAHLGERFKEVVAKAEILSPGISIPTFDAKFPAAQTLDSICKFRRRTLDRAWNTQDSRVHVETICGNVDLPKKMRAMDCNSVRMLFDGASALASKANNQLTTGPGKAGKGRDGVNAGPSTLGEINARNRELYGQGKNG
jgi:hypothetical protein